MSHRCIRALFALILTLSVSAVAPAVWAQTSQADSTTSAGQKSAPPSEPSTAAAPPRQEERTAQTLATLGELRKVLAQYPPSVGFVIALDPVLLTNAEFLGAYPALAEFLDAHPEVRRNPAFYFPARREARQDGPGPSGATVAILIPLGFFATMVAIGWFVYQRSRAAIQARQETTGKLIDGLLAREDLVSHLDSPAGRRIVDSLNQRPEPTPASRVIRSVEAGVVLTFLGAGFGALRVMLALDEDGRTGFAVAAIVLATIGLGLLASAGISYLLSRRFGLIETSGTRD